MLGPVRERKTKLFYQFDLEAVVPQDHLLRRIERVMDWSFVRPAVAHCYGDNGHVSEDPIVLLKLMMLLYLYNVKSERELLRQLPLQLGWLWFCGFDIDELEEIPNHSVLSKARRLWGRELFVRLFERVLAACVEANLVDGSTVYVDSSTNAANASMDSLRTHLRAAGVELYETLEQASETSEPAATPPEPAAVPPEPAAGEAAEPCDPTVAVAPPQPGDRISRTDPEARLAKKNGKTTLGYKDHRVVDSKCGVITATLTTGADVDDASMLVPAIRRHERSLEAHRPDGQVKVAVADKGYGTAGNYHRLHQRGTRCCIPHKKVREDPDKFPRSLFVYNPLADTYTCPAGQILRRGGQRYHAAMGVCRSCPLRDQCTNDTYHGRQLRRHPLQDEIDRADATFSREHRRRLLRGRKTVGEGSFADAANQHGYKRHRWRGLGRAMIQNQLIASVQNLRKLVGRRRGRRTSALGRLSPVPAYRLLFEARRLRRRRLRGPRRRPSQKTLLALKR